MHSFFSSSITMLLVGGSPTIRSLAWRYMILFRIRHLQTVAVLYRSILASIIAVVKKTLISYVSDDFEVSLS